MYKDVTIEKFRGISRLDLADLGETNLFVGANNVGKTSVLEAIWLLEGAGDPARLIDVSARRGLTPRRSSLQQAWNGAFHNFQSDSDIVIYASTAKGGSLHLRVSIEEGVDELVERTQRTLFDTDDDRRATLQLQPVLKMEFRSGDDQQTVSALSSDSRSAIYRDSRAPETSTAFIGSNRDIGVARLASLFTEAEDRGRLSLVVRDLRSVFPELSRLSVGFNEQDDRPTIRAFISSDPEPVPFHLFGDGAKRLLSFLLAIHAQNAPYVFIDEIENGIYYRAQRDVWKSLERALRESSMQLFATTHSLELVDSVLTAMADDTTAQKGFRLHRLEKEDGVLRSVTYSYADLLETRELNWEFR